MTDLLQTAIELERVAAQLRKHVRTGIREMIARDLSRLAGIPYDVALQRIDANIRATTRQRIHDIVRPLL